MKILIVFIILLLLSSVAEALPTWTQNSVSVPSGSQYSPERNYGFEINWTDASGISTVILEWNGNNYTANNNGDIFYYNLTGLAVGTYSYRWFANNTAGESTYSDFFSYQIEKNSSASFILELNDTEGNRSYSRYWAAKFTATLNVPGKTIFLDSNYPGLSVYNDSSAIYHVEDLTTAGFFSLSAVWNGNENYTGTSKTYYFDSQGPQYSNIVSSPLDQVTYEPGTVYYFNVSWMDATLEEVRFESNFSGSKKNYTKSTNPKVYNNSNLFWVNISDMSAKEFVYTWYARDSLNNWTATNQRIYRIFKGHALNLYSPYTEVVNGTTSVFNCYSLTNQIDVDDFKFYRNSTLINNTSSLSRSDISILEVGFYRYVCNTTGNQNYSNQTLKANLTVLPPEAEEESEEKKEFKITDVSSPSITVGETGQGNFNLSSTFDETITEISVELKDFNGTYTVDEVPSALLKGGSVIIRINFDIPSEYETGTSNISLRVVGKTENGTVIATSYMMLTVNSVMPPVNLPPSYSSVISEPLNDEYVVAFSLYDDQGLSGYIFSTNETGTWVNDSWVPLEGSIVDINFTREYVSTGLVWKAYFNDTDNLWSVSDEYYIAKVGGEFDYTVPIIIVISFVALAIVLFIIQRMRNKKTEKKVVYVYTKEDR